MRKHRLLLTNGAGLGTGVMIYQESDIVRSALNETFFCKFMMHDGGGAGDDDKSNRYFNCSSDSDGNNTNEYNKIIKNNK